MTFIILVYFSVLLGIAFYTSRHSTNESFFIGNRSSKWWLVAFGMIGSRIIILAIGDAKSAAKINMIDLWMAKPDNVAEIRVGLEGGAVRRPGETVRLGLHALLRLAGGHDQLADLAAQAHDLHVGHQALAGQGLGHVQLALDQGDAVAAGGTGFVEHPAPVFIGLAFGGLQFGMRGQLGREGQRPATGFGFQPGLGGQQGQALGLAFVLLRFEAGRVQPRQRLPLVDLLTVAHQQLPQDAALQTGNHLFAPLGHDPRLGPGDHLDVRQCGPGRGHQHGEQDPHNVNRHDDRIKAFCMTFDEPMSWSTVAAAFDALVTYRGPDLLRMKGILNVKDTDKPVVIHGVQHVFHPPATLEAWPEGDDRKSRVVFITRDIAESTIRKVFASFFDAEKKGWGQGEQQQQQ